MSNDRLIPTNSTASVVTVLIRINGAEIPKTFQVLSTIISKEVNRIPFAKIVLKDGDPAKEDFPASNDDLFVPGNNIEVLAGYAANEDLLFKGVIVKQGIQIRTNGGSYLKLDCRDVLFKTTLVKNNNYYEELTDSDAVEEILSNYNIDSNISVTDVTHSELVQYEQTDWEFILTRSELNGFICVVDDGSFSFQKPDLQQEALITLIYGASVLEFDGEIDARLQYDSVKAHSWDAANQELIEVEAAEPTLQDIGNLSIDDLTAVADKPSLTLRHGGQVIQDKLQSWADAELLKIRLSKSRGRVRFHGFPTVKPNNIVKLQGFGDRFNGTVFVSGVRHEIQGGTWQTDIQFGLQDLSPNYSLFSNNQKPKKNASEISGLQIGVVTQIEDDPAGENRILVKLPIVNINSQGTWARLATLDAGENRGMFFLPEEGDEVIVGFVNNDPRNLVILGMLHSSKMKAPFEASKDNFEKGYVSKSGIKMVFDDDKESIRIETPAGKYITLDDNEGIIELEDENKNKLIMNSDGITIESSGRLELKSGTELKIEGGTDLQIKAGANLKAEGTTGAELSTNAVAVLKGSLVQIN